MADDGDKLERTEKATPRRREEARKKGQVAKSKELSSVAILLAGLGSFYLLGDRILISLKEHMQVLLFKSGTLNLADGGIYMFLTDQLVSFSYIIMPPLLLISLAAVAVNIAQVGFLVSAEAVTPNFSRLNPVEGAKKFLSLNSLTELVKGVMKLAIVGYAAYLTIRGEVSNFGHIVGSDTGEIIYYMGRTAFRVLLNTSWVLVILAVLDYLYQRWEMEKGLRMTKHEIKEENKEMEGNPMIKSRIRSLQRQMSRNRMMQDVPKATVVITNPTHFAVAVRYERGGSGAPVVVAKGRDKLAAKIKDMASKNAVPMIENRMLARVLWKEVDVGKEIPVSLYKAVAEVLAYVYALGRAR